MSVQTMSLLEALGRYVGTLKGDDRQEQQTELNRFLRWFEGRQVSELDAMDVERFQEAVEKSGADAARRLEPVKAFLAWLHKQGYSDVNYGKFIKIKRSMRRSNAVPVEQESERLTAEGYQKLQEELQHLIEVKRPEIAQALYDARLDKDFRENAPYDAAKHHQAEVEARIRQLERVLATATLLEAPRRGDRAHLGATIVVRDLEHDEELTYTLVSPQEANPKQGKISAASPVGRALLDRRVGETVDVEAPGGTMQWRIERIND